MRKRLVINALVCGAFIAGVATGSAHAQSGGSGQADTPVDPASSAPATNPHGTPKVARDRDSRGGANASNTDVQNPPACVGPPSFCNTYFGGS
ncbi:hypothetical protein HDG37_003577 [Paraburkholderia sp. MM5384-R2]|nr:hypothetical protein [Paraburkholderia sp. MM5384-R2]